MSNRMRHRTVGTRRRGRLALFVSACSLLLLGTAFLAMPLTVSADHGGGSGGAAQNDSHSRDGNSNQMDKNDDRGKDVVDRDNDKNRGNDVDANDNHGNNAVDNDVNDAVDNDAVMVIPPVPGMAAVPHEQDNDR